MKNFRRIMLLKSCMKRLEANRQAASILADECQWLEYPEAVNPWFRSFVLSFGTCENRKISEKQMGVFSRYAEEEHNPNPANNETSYLCRVGLLRIKATKFLNGCYLSITESPVDEINRLIDLC